MHICLRYFNLNILQIIWGQSLLFENGSSNKNSPSIKPHLMPIFHVISKNFRECKVLGFYSCLTHT